MCIIAIKPKGKEMFPESTIRTMFANNPDGSGYMYTYDEHLVIHKGFMTVDDLLKDLDRNGQIIDSYNKTIVFHFRIGTSGFNDRLNCHPYPIYEKNATTIWDAEIGVAHNGILKDYEPSKNSDINDTQVFIKEVLRGLKKGFQYDKDKMFLISELIGSNKLAFLDENGYLGLVGNFITDNGYIYSNSSYKTLKQAKKTFKLNSVPRDYSNPYTSIWDDDEEYGFWKEFDEK